MKDRKTKYYLSHNGHSCEDFYTGNVYRFWYDPTGTWMAEVIWHPQADVNTFDCTEYL